MTAPTYLIAAGIVAMSVAPSWAWDNLSDVPGKVVLVVNGASIESSFSRAARSPELTKVSRNGRAVTYCFKDATFAKIDDDFWAINAPARAMVPSVIIARDREYEIKDAIAGPSRNTAMAFALTSISPEAARGCRI